MSTTRQPLYAPDGKVVAVIVGGALTKTVSGSIHFLRSPRAIALDLGAVQAAEAQGVSQIFISDRETSTVYRSTVTELYRHGWRFNRGWGEQIAMRLDRWQRDSDQVKTTETQPPERPPAAALQLPLL
jgi:hypothetical protein